MFIEIVSPPFVAGYKILTHKGNVLSPDQLSPDMCCVFEIERTTKKDQALALITMKLAGKNVPGIKRIF